VAFKLSIDKVELVDNEFKLFNIVVDVEFNLLTDNVELVDNEFKLLNIVDDVAFVTHRWAERLSKVMKYLHREFYRLKTFFPLK
jgi:hypothetical protein